MSRVGLAATATYLPDRWMPATEISELSGIPTEVLVDKFGLRGKHIAADNEHVSDMCVEVGRRLLDEHGFDPAGIGSVLYFGSTWKDYTVWQAAPWIAHRLGCVNAFAFEYDNVSCGSPMAVRAARNLLLAEPHVGSVLAVAASRESHLLDYANERARFMFNFGDGAVAALLVRDHPDNEVLGSHAITEGSFSLQVKVPGGGSAEPDNEYRFLDVLNPWEMKDRLDPISLPNFVTAAEVDFVCPLHTKRSMLTALLGELGMRQDQAIYLDDTGHMSGIDPLLGLDRAARDGRLHDGDFVLLLAAGTGYTWAAAVVRWGRGSP